MEERVCRLLQRCLHRPLSAQTLQPLGPSAADYMEPSRGKACYICVFSVKSLPCRNGMEKHLKSILSFAPVQAQCANFEYMLWFESLLFYGFEEHSTLQRGDGDIGLLPAIVEKVIVSKLTGMETHTAASTIPRNVCFV